MHHRSTAVTLLALIALTACDAAGPVIGDPPEITGITPSVLAAGDTAVITGTDLGGDNRPVAVTLAGAPVRVLHASPTELVAVMPPAGAFPCTVAGEEALTVRVDGQETVVLHAVAGPTERTLAPGESAILFDDGVGCSALTEAGDYLVTVVNPVPDASVLTPFTLRGGSGEAAAATAGGRLLRIGKHPARVEGAGPIEAHARVRAMKQRELSHLGTPAPEKFLASAIVPPSSAQPGDVREIRYPHFLEYGCDAYSTITARAAYVGDRVVVWEDQAGPLAGTIDAELETIGRTFDEAIYPLLLESFGDPLAPDSLLGAHGRVFMLFTPEVKNELADLNGFVSPQDLYPRDQCASSSQAVGFYGYAPVAADMVPDGLPEWRWELPGLVAHEMAHATRFAQMMAAGSGLSGGWLLEPLAQLAAEQYARAAQGYSPTGNTGYEESVWCEVRSVMGVPECQGIPGIMGWHFLSLGDYMAGPEALSIVEQTRADDWSNYGSGWLFLRWAIDHSGVSEVDFLRAVNHNFNPDHTAIIEESTGRPFRELLAEFGLALALDDHPDVTPHRETLSVPSWNIRDVLAGAYRDASEYPALSLDEAFPAPWRLEPYAVTGSFEAAGDVRGASAAYFEVEATAGQLLQLGGSRPGVAAPELGLGVVRLR